VAARRADAVIAASRRQARDHPALRPDPEGARDPRSGRAVVSAVRDPWAERVRRSYGLTTASSYVGTIEPRKNLPMLTDGFARRRRTET
jgi:hypothetical protein